MLADLTKDQRELAELMSEISEEAFCAGWMKGLELALWDAVTRGTREYGRMEIDNDRIDRLRDLARACDGWIVFDDDREEVWVPMPDWIQRFKHWHDQSQHSD